MSRMIWSGQLTNGVSVLETEEDVNGINMQGNTMSIVLNMSFGCLFQ